MTDDNPLPVEIVHRGRRRLVDVVLEASAVDPDGLRYVPDEPRGYAIPHYVDDQQIGYVVGGVVVEIRLVGGHELTDRFLEEMAQDLGPAVEPGDGA